jgi:hypothetical protein
MKLRTLWNNVMLQGQLRVKVYDHSKDEFTVNRKVQEFFENNDLVTWENLLDREITFIYPQCNAESEWEDELVLELEAEEE